jgi:hypothetical protein
MLRIREEQMQHLAKRTQKRFVGMLEQYLRRHFPRWVAGLSDEQLRGWLEHALGKAERFGVTTEPEAAQLILLFLVMGVDADERLPWVEETLAARTLAPIGKVKKLVALAREHHVDGVEHVVVYEGMEA